MARPVVVIGDGASGVLVALALSRRGVGPVLLVGDGSTPGAGCAYGTTEPYHLLNARAGTMSARADVPDDLVGWSRTTSRPVDADAFLPRRRYAGYLADRLGSLPGTDRVAGRAVGLREDAGAVEVTLADGRRIGGDAAVLAVGHAAPATPRVPGLAGNPWYVADPWAPGALDRITSADRVVLLGTGLTAVDVALVVHRRRPDGRLRALSRHGLLPAAHRTDPPETVRLSRIPTTTTGLLRAVRRAVAAGADWRAVVDGLRCDAGPAWQALSPVERDRFRRHVDRYWQVHRHRMAPPVATAVDAMRDAGTLTVTRGTLARVESGRNGLTATCADGSTVHCGLLVNCTGPGRWATGTDPLAVSVRGTGLARLDDSATGLRCDAYGRLAGSGRVFALGPPRLGDSWETTAIPEIRAQADTIAAALAAVPARRPAA
ncbi:FAD/NAD(P)-binding protein [Actinocatenispora rupis]|uniref:FAD-dependent urate hydroxylase HpyO/Asp monooxygenase CreE-like FAD/NAD(P)-binding domain-containing protein n=1 Tax=Actinocatenispora rupis TaxID=519421 RepID=A0A8J3JAE5_9ACTN|nr:FAD/NAD(P)-binding protein [Actinocatenispora rupis]GID11178.1 hypothetical protein Aru02nite_20670 [Actinocatenispora rupis]